MILIEKIVLVKLIVMSINSLAAKSKKGGNPPEAPNSFARGSLKGQTPSRTGEILHCQCAGNMVEQGSGIKLKTCFR